MTGLRQNKYEDERVYIELNLENLDHNVDVLSEALPSGCQLMAVVKANAYGAGAKDIALRLSKHGVEAFCVATLEEAIELRSFGILGSILILGYTPPSKAELLRRYDLTQTLTDYDYAKALSLQGFNISAHMKIDTGMHRLGFDHFDLESIAAAFSLDCLNITGIYTHLCCADSLEPEDVAFTNTQITRFYDVLSMLRRENIPVPKTHIQSSYGLLNYPEVKYDYVRAGISLYGVLSTPEDNTRLKPDLRPVLSLRSSIIQLRRIKAGESVGYGRDFTAERDSLIAVIPAGYADGYPRNLSNGKGHVLISGCLAPVAGRVSMDQLTADVTDIPGVCVGMPVTLIGEEGAGAVTAPQLASNGETITNELLSRLGSRPVRTCI